MNFIRHSYGAAWSYVKSLWRYLLVVSIVFLALVGMSWVALAMNPDVLAAVMAAIMKSFSQKDLYDMTGNIFVPNLIANNLAATLSGVISGFIPFFFLPLFPLAINAAIIGALGAMVQAANMSLGFFLAGLIPHGIFELPAMVLSYGMGLYLCVGLNRIIIRSPKAVPFGTILKNISLLWGLVVMPLLIIAGVVEVYLTPMIMTHFI